MELPEQGMMLDVNFPLGQIVEIDQRLGREVRYGIRSMVPDYATPYLFKPADLVFLYPHGRISDEKAIAMAIAVLRGDRVAALALADAIVAGEV